MPSETTGLQLMGAGGLSLVNEKRKPVRRDPEKRRQQNIQAQRKYREKLRQRLDRLEALAASAAENRAATGTPAAAAATGASVATLPPSSVAIPATIPPPQNALALPSTSTQILQSTATSPSSAWESYPTSEFIDVRWADPRHTPPSDVTSSTSDLSIWDASTYIDPSFLVRDKTKSATDHYCTVTVDCGCTTAHSHVLSRTPEAFNRGEFKIITFAGRSPAVGGADPYANNLRLETVCTLAAMSALGTYIGISQEVLCAEESQSPFFRPGAALLPADRADTAVRTVQKIFGTLKPDLRPGREQITVEHHPYIDILPFPTLRRNLIMESKKLDEDEFFEDVLVGLVCWGGAGLGRRDREAATGHASTGTPWDVRSWEAKAWFVKKYWVLLGGEDGELVRQSEWWRGMRGEGALELAGYDQGERVGGWVCS